MHHFCGGYAFIPMDDYSFTFSASATGTYICHSRATQCKGLGIYYRFFTNLECAQFEGTICGQVLRICLIESHSPIMKSAKIKEATSHMLKCFWRTHRVTKYNCDIAHQPIVHQSFSTRCQEMQILRSQTKERKSMTAIVADQFCLWVMSWGKL